MNKTIAAAVVAASLAGGALVGTAFGGPSLAGAAETATGAAGWVGEALSGLVSGGTITQEQADAVETALEEARPERPFGGHHHHRARVALAAVAEVLDVSLDDLRAAFQADKTIADLAAEKGVEVQKVVDAIVAAHKAHLDEKVAAGDLTQAQADEKLAGAEERATAFVNGERPLRGHRHHHGPPPGDAGTEAEAGSQQADAA